MGSLSNLYISQSYISLIHLGSDTSVTTASVELQDGLGNGIGVFVNSLGDVQIEGQLSASNIPADIATQAELNAYTASTNARLNNIESTTASLNVSVSNINSFTASQNTKDSTLATYTASVNSKFDAVGASTASINAFTASQQSFNASATASIVQLLNLSSSLSGGFVTEGELAAATASLINQIDTKLNTSSFNAYTQSNDNKVNSLINATSSYAISSSVAAVDYAQQQQINSLIAVTASFVTSSTNISSLNAFTASQETKNSTLASVTASYDQKFSNIGAQSGSWVSASITGSSVVDIFNTIADYQFTYTKGDGTQQTVTLNAPAQTDITSLNAFTASQETKNSTLQTYTASVNSSLNNLNAYTSSNDQKWTNLQILSGSLLQTASFSNNTIAFTKVDGAPNNLYGIASTGSNTFNGNQIINGTSTQTFNEPGNNNQVDVIKVNSFVDSRGYTMANNTLGWQHYDGAIVGWGQDIFNGNFTVGTSIAQSSNEIKWVMYPSGANAADWAYVTLTDNGNRTTTLELEASNILIDGNTTITGSVIISGSSTTDLNVIGQAKQTFNEPGNDQEVQVVKVNTFTDSNGYSLQNNTWGWYHYNSEGHEGFSSQLYTGDYAYGSAFFHDPEKWEYILFPSGSPYDTNKFGLYDNGNKTTQFIVETDRLNFTGSVGITSTLTASLQQGYVWVGNASGRTTTVPTSSFGSTVDLTSLNAFTASQNTKNTTLESVTASLQSQLTNIGSQSASWDNTSLNQFTSSQQTKNATLATYTASVDNSISQLNTFTSSQETKNSTLANVTASLQQQLTNIGSQSGSWITESETGSFARYDVSNPWSANQTFTNITAVSASFQYVQTVFETASVIYSSGSNQFGDAADDVQTLYGSTRIVNELTASGLHYPTADNGPESFIQTDGAGNLSLQYVKTLYQNIRNMETSSIIKGTPLFASGSTGDNVNVYIADAANPLRMPATLIAGDNTLAASATGKGIILGHIEGVNTTGYPAGTEVYVAPGGGWTSTRPTGSSTPIQPLGIVTREGINGMGIVLTVPPVTLPNIQTGYTWVGNGNSQPIAVATSSFASLTDLSSLNAFTASQETKNTTLANVTSSLNAYTASQNTINSNVATSASLYNAKFDNLASQSGSWVNVPLDSLNAFTASQDTKNSTLASYTASVNISLNNINAFTQSIIGTNAWTASIDTKFATIASQSGSWENVPLTSLNAYTASNDQKWSDLQPISGTLLQTASFSANTLAFTKLNGGPMNIVGIASTGSNTFIGNQTITGQMKATFDQPANNNQIDNLKVNSWSDKYGYTITNSTLGWQRYEGTAEGWVQELYTGDYGYGSSVRHEPSAMTWQLFPSGAAYDSNEVTLFDNGDTTTTFKVLADKIQLTGSLNVSSTITASLQQGYVWVGNSSGRTTTVATSSFATNISNLATTGSNTFIGNQTISGSARLTGSVIASKLSVYDFDSLYYGSQLGGTTTNGTFFGYGSSDYSFILGAYAGGFDNELQTYVDSTGIYLKDFNGSGYNTFLRLRPNSGSNPAPIFTRGAEITGSMSVSGSINVQTGSVVGQAVTNITPVSSSQQSVLNMVTLTQSEYNLITPNNRTLYIII